jgi:flagella basal body P-ring formation protein FlgA
MIYLLCASVFAQQTDFLSRVAETLLLESAERLQLDPKDLSIQNLGIQSSKCSDDAEISLYIPNHEDFRGNVDVYIEGSESGKMCGKWRTSSTIAVNKKLWVAVQDTAPGQPIETVERVIRYDLTTGTPVTNGETLQARTHIRAGSMVSVERSQRIPAARDGSRVSLVVQVGGLSIHSEAELMGDAHIGESVRVIAMASRQVVEGTLVSPELVSISLGGQQ